MSKRVRVSRLFLAVTGAVLLAGCAGANEQQSALNPGGPAARTIDVHWQTMLVVGTAVWVIVMAMTVATLVRRRRRDREEPREGEESREREDRENRGRRAPTFVAVGGAIIPAAIIIGIMAQGMWVLQETDPGQDVEGTTIAVTAYQYWWEVEYPEHGVITANEIHIPAGEPVELELNSDDVVHSVWVPELGGKVDMIPGRTSSMWLEADQPGTYWGQCAEYCGMQHALMRFVVVAHEPAEFEGWLQAQAQPAADLVVPAGGPGSEVEGSEVEGSEVEGSEIPGSELQGSEVPGSEIQGSDIQGSEVEGSEAEGQPTPAEQDEALVVQGREVFMSSSCVYCHTIGGTEAQGTDGPDLTHLASRQTLGAGTLPNNPGNLAAWVVDPQAIKPGNEMPGTDLAGEELLALLAYLESLE